MKYEFRESLCLRYFYELMCSVEFIFASWKCNYLFHRFTVSPGNETFNVCHVLQCKHSMYEWYIFLYIYNKVNPKDCFQFLLRSNSYKLFNMEYQEYHEYHEYQELQEYQEYQEYHDYQEYQEYQEY